MSALLVLSTAYHAPPGVAPFWEIIVATDRDKDAPRLLLRTTDEAVAKRAEAVEATDTRIDLDPRDAVPLSSPVRRPPRPAGFRHGMRVRMGGIDGPLGVLFECRGGEYWQVRLQGVPTRWVRPQGLIVDGPGDRVVPACASCGLPFVSDGDPICDRCSVEQFGTAAQRHDDAAPDSPDRDRLRYGFQGRRRNHS